METTGPSLMLAAVLTLAAGGVHAQSTVASPPSGQGAQEMANMPGMNGASTPDMAVIMKQCAQMKAQMKAQIKAGTKMSPDMQPMMERCDKMDRSMGTTKAPDDTLSR